jgi:hypothetical protein
MDVTTMQQKLTVMEEQKTKLEGVYAQLIGQINLMKSLIEEENKIPVEAKK